jgi:hypothetical protein
LAKTVWIKIAKFGRFGIRVQGYWGTFRGPDISFWEELVDLTDLVAVAESFASLLGHTVEVFACNDGGEPVA